MNNNYNGKNLDAIIMAIKKVKKTIIIFVPPVLLTVFYNLRLGFFKLKKLLIEKNTNRCLPSLCIQYTNDLKLPNILKITIEGYKYPFYIRNNTSDINVYKAIIENKEYNFITSQDPKVIIDAGANIGLSTIYFAEKYPKCKIISIEPEENNFRMLKENTKNYPNIIPLNAALWNKVGEIELLDTGLDNWGFMTEDSSNYDNITVPQKKLRHTVKTITMEKLLNDYNLVLIDILKIDIEGAEKEVFQNHSLWINNVRSIIVELHERRKHGCEKEFRKIAKNFDEIAQCGEDIYLSKSGFIKMT